ncbi:MAG: hypothetical protein QM790_11680 [Nibricoccus sp.]
MYLSSSILAAAAVTQIEPLFGNQWVALLVILVGVAVLLFAVAGVGKWLAATHPDEPVAPKPAPVTIETSSDAPSAEVFAAIAAAVAVTFGSKSRIAAIHPSSIAIEPGPLQWSAEGRRQIYSSHKVR